MRETKALVSQIRVDGIAHLELGDDAPKWTRV